MKEPQLTFTEQGIPQIHNPLSEEVPPKLSPKSTTPYFEAMPPSAAFTHQWKQPGRENLSWSGSDDREPG